MPLQGFALAAVPRAPHLADQPLLDALRRALPDAALTEALTAASAQAQRRRLWPARLVVALVVAMGRWGRAGLRDVLANLVAGLRERDPTAWADWHLPAKSALTQARQRLGPRPLLLLFRRLGGPVATADTPGAFLFGLRLMASDGTTLKLPDTPANAQRCGRARTSRGTGQGACPHLRIVWLVEAGTQVLCAATRRPYFRGDAPAARQLLRAVGSDRLVMWDRGLHSYELIRDRQRRAAHFLGRVGKASVLTPEQVLPDGSSLASVSPTPTARRHQQGGSRVRVSAYTLDDPARPGQGERHRLITSLLAPAAAAAAPLAAEYHQRGEGETTAAAVNTHQADRHPAPPVRSRRPREVVQEVSGLLRAHRAVRLTMAEAAARAGVAPDRLSIPGTLRLLRRARPRFQRSVTLADPLPFALRGC